MGLYGERIGFLGGVVNDKNVVPNIMTQLSLIIRPMYSNPCGQGAKIVGKILADPVLYKDWTEELKTNVKRLTVMIIFTIITTYSRNNPYYNHFTNYFSFTKYYQGC